MTIENPHGRWNPRWSPAALAEVLAASRRGTKRRDLANTHGISLSRLDQVLAKARRAEAATLRHVMTSSPHNLPRDPDAPPAPWNSQRYRKG